MRGIIDSHEPVLVAGTNTAFRGMVQSVLQALGFKRVEVASELAIAVNRIESDYYGWVLLGLESHDTVNGINMLEQIQQHEALCGLKVSLLITDQEGDYLARAFELGVVSYHLLSASASQLTQELAALKALAAELHHDYRLVAATYLKGYLIERGYLRDLLAFLEQLVSVYPDSSHALLLLAEAYIAADRNHQALSVLNQVNLINPLAKAKTEPLIEKTIVFEKGKVKIPDIKPFPTLKVAVILADECEEIHNLAVQLKEFYIEPVIVKPADWAAAPLAKAAVVLVDWCQKEAFVLDILEGLFATEHREVPVIAMLPAGESIQRDQCPLVGLSAVLMRPFTTGSVARALTIVAHTCKRQPRLQAYLYHCLYQQKFKQAQILKSDFFRKALLLEGEKLEIEAVIALFGKEHLRVRDVAQKALQTTARGTRVLAYLGTALAEIHDYGGAYSCLRKAEYTDLPGWLMLFGLARKDLSQSPKLTAMEKAVLVMVTDRHVALAMSLVRCSDKTEGIYEALAIWHYLKQKPFSCLRVMIINKIATCLLEAQLLKEARSFYVMVHKKLKDKNERAKIKHKVQEIDKLLAANKPYASFRSGGVRTNPNLKHLIEHAGDVKLSDAGTRGIYTNHQNKTDTKFLVVKPVKFRVGTIWPGGKKVS